MNIVIVCGPTATGKTRLAADIALAFGGEVVNADSMQVYRGMDIASAMPDFADIGETRGVPHHLYGFLEPETAFSVADYLPLARKKIAEITKRGRLPIIAGGTGQYVSSIIDCVDFDDITPDYAFRAQMSRFAAENGNSCLFEKLREVNPEAASRLHENNVKRVIRALEIARAGKTDTRVNADTDYTPIVFALDFKDRQTLYNRINRRVDIMLEKGLLKEAEELYKKSGLVSISSSQAIGHKEFLPYFKGEAGIDECVENLKKRTRNYAKRQLTWFRRVKNVNWLIMEDEDGYSDAFNAAQLVIKNFLSSSAVDSGFPWK